MQYTAEIATKTGDSIGITIVTPGAGSNKELLLSADAPIVIDYEADDLFKPLKISGCSVKILTEEPLLDLYTGQLNSISLEVKRGETLVWFGYLTPNVYSQAYDDAYDELTLEFVDVLSVMESVKYVRKNAGQWRSFGTYFAEALQKAQGLDSGVGTVSGLDMSLSGGVTSGLLSEIGVMERNFVDETDDDDNAMTYKEVLEEICRYLNVQAVCYGDKIYLVDTMVHHDAVSLSDAGIFEGGGTISMGEMYNRVTVVESTNPIDDILYQNVLDDNVQEDCMLKTLDSEYYDDNVGCYVVPIKYDGHWYVDMRGLYRPKSSSGWWMMGSGLILATCSSDSKSLSYHTPVDGYGNEMEKGAFTLFSSSYEQKNIPSKIEWTKSAIMFCNFEGMGYEKKWQIKGLQTTPFIKYQKTNHSVVMKGGYIVLSLTYKYLPKPYTPLEYEHIGYSTDWTMKDFVDHYNEDHFSDEDDISSYGFDYFRVKLKIGNKYYNGSKWTTTESTFEVKHTWKGTESIYNSDAELDNTNTYLLGTNEDVKGFAIPVGNESLFGDVYFELCAPTYLGKGFFPGLKYRRSYVFGAVAISDLKLTYCSKVSNGSQVLDLESKNEDIAITGTAYYKNIIDMDDVEMKVNTWSSLQNSYSYVIRKDASNQMTYYIPDVQPEKKLIGRLLEYYGKRMLQFGVCVNNTSSNRVLPWSNMTVPAFGGKRFAVCGLSYDMVSDSVNVELKEID